jgi:hypothetical protein
MVTPPNFNDNNPNNTNMNNDVNQWCQDNAQMQADKTTLNNALAAMAADIGKGKGDNTDGALMLLFTAVLPGVLTYQQDSMNMLADSQNISSDLRNFNNSIQDDFNAGGNITYPQAQDLYNNVNDLNTWAKFLSTAQPGGWTTADAPLSAANATEIENNTAGIENSFEGNGGSGNWNPSTIQQDMANWFATPVTELPNGPNYVPTPSSDPAGPAPEIKAIQGNTQQINSAVSSQATTLNTQIQFFTGQYNQFVNVQSSLQKSQISQDNSFVSNQKTQ